MKRFILVGLLIFVGILAAPFVGFACWAFYREIVPYHKTEITLADPPVKLCFKLYLTYDEQQDSGRYMTATYQEQTITQMMAGFDWAHYARTNIYRLKDGSLVITASRQNADFAVPAGYRLTFNPLQFMPLNQGMSDDWQYLGAFDLVTLAPYKQELKFFDTRQRTVHEGPNQH